MMILKRFYIIFLILTSFSLRLIQPHPYSIYNDFKWRLMYFVEPFLKNVQIHGNKMEGDSFISIADEITSSFTRYAAGLSSLSKNDVDEKEIKTFSMYTKMLNTGLNLYKKLVKIKEDSFERVTEICVKYQFEFLEELKECETRAAILPITWGGSQPHATTLYIRWHGGDFYDLAFINTGDGLEFHNSFKDPNNVYPFLCQAWIEFEKIPEYEIFDEVAWFLQALIHVNHNHYLYIVRDGVESIKNYFYGTILSNFYKYQKEDDNEDAEENNKKLIPMQRSGSCVFSCLMAAFLYHCPDEKTFYLYRLRFGNHFLKEFLEKYQKSPEFISIITDSFETVGRNLFYRLASAQAGHVLQYLENVLPTESKHIGLLGKNRLDWIQWKITNVPKVLQSNHYLIDLIRKSTDVSLSILSILRKYPTTCENSTIHIDERLDTFIPATALLDFKSISQYDQLMLSPNVPSITLSSRPKRWWNEINSIEIFVDKLVNLTKSSVRCYYNNALDLFQKVGSGLWEWMDLICETDSLRLLESLKLLLFRFLSEKSGPLSFEDVVLLGNIQLAAWKAAVAYDNFQSDPIGLSKFHPPNTVQNLIFFHNILSNGRKRWLVQNCFSSNSLKMFKSLISELEDSVNVEVILHPFQAFDSNTEDMGENNETYRTEETVRDHFDVNEYCDDILPKLTLHRGLYEKMGKNKIIQERLLSDEYRHRKEIYALISIIFSDSYLMQTQFPQFDLLMNILFGINFVRYNQQIISKSFTPSDPWMASQLSKYSHSIQVRYKFECKYKKSVKLFPCKSDDSFFINLGSTQYLLASSSLEFKHLFYTARHSEASINPSSVVNLESWLNFVKNAKGTELFCNPYFVYLSDRILNLPQFTRTSENKVNLEIAAMYPDGFGLSIINEIFESLFVIIQRDLRTLITKKNSLGVEKKMKAVSKIVELCIILVRFIDRIENDQIVPVELTVNMLTSVYNLLYPISKLSNESLLPESCISSFNLVLAHICNIPIRDEMIFNEATQLNFGGVGPNRQSLAKFHWFITNLFYKLKTRDYYLADDQFNYGFVDSPLVKEERGFLEILLISSFLPVITKKQPEECYYSFHYSNDGNIIEIGDAEADSRVIVQLNKGICILNGKRVIDKSSILNHYKFSEYLQTHHLNHHQLAAASQGVLTQIDDEGATLYSLKDFPINKQDTVIYYHESVLFEIFRKWNGNWYTWCGEPSQMRTFEKLTKYQSVSESKNIYIRQLERTGDLKNTVNVEYLLFENAQIEPTIRVQINSHFVSMFCFDFNADDDDDVGWTLLDSNYKLDKHFESFSESSRILAKTSDERLVVIYPKVRVSVQDVQRPLVLLERNSGNGGFDVLNLPGYIVNLNQSLFNGSIGIPGGLSIFHQEKKLFLLPNNQVLSRSNTYPASSFSLNASKPIFLEHIPIIDDQPTPQTRLQKILLSYYYLLSSEYTKAKNILHPAKCSFQNEALTVEEMDVIHWIINIGGGSPEELAVKIIAFMHILVNQTKFPREYHLDATTTNSTSVEKNKIIFDMKSKLRSIFFNYLMSIREIPEKFYSYRLFPEIVTSSEYWNSTFGSSAFQLPGTNLPLSYNNAYWINKPTRRTDSKNLTSTPSITDMIHQDEEKFLTILHYNFDENKNYFKLLKRLLHRRTATTLLDNKFAMATFCYLNEPELWFDFVSNLKSSAFYDDIPKVDPKDFTRDYSECRKRFTDAMKACHQKYKNDFVGINGGSGSTMTSLDSIRNVFLTDLNRNCTNRDVQDNNGGTESVNRAFEFDLNNQLGNLIEYIRLRLTDTLKIVNVNESTIPPSLPFSVLMKNSKILSKLFTSINNFLIENGLPSPKQKHFDLRQDDSSSDIEKLQVLIQNEITRLIFRQKDALNQLICKTGRYFDPRPTQTVELLNRLFHQKKVKSFSDLYSCYLKNSLTCFQHKFPHFTKEECIELQRDTFTFYSQQVLLDHLHYIYDLARKLLISAAQVTFGELETFCDELKKFTEFKYRHGNPAILIFEFRSEKYRLRSEQVKDIELLTSTITSTRDSTQNGYHSVVIQRMMAAGKTLILGTISVIQKALNRNTLSILVPPSSLYQSNTKTMQEISYKYFKRKGENFMFPRFSLSDRTIGKYLDHVIDLITRTMESGDYLILSPNSLHSFLNSYLEWLNAFHNRNDTTICNFSFSVLKQFATVYNIFKQKGSIILDEIDLTMDPRKELNFPTVETESYNMVAVALIVDIFEFTLFDQNIKLAGLDILGNNQASLTSKAYENCRNIILNYIETQLKEKRSIWGHLLFDFNDNIVLKAEDVMKFIRNPDMDAEVDWINGLDSTVVDRATVDSFIVLKLHLYIYFEDSLKGTVNQDYGSAGSKRSAIKYAVPYVAANTPSTDSIFSDRWETLSKTLLMAASVPCTVKTAKDVSSYLKDILLIEIKSKYCPTRSLLKILIPDIKPEFIDLESGEHFERIHQVLRERSPASMKLLFRYFVKIVFGNMKFHVEQITSNALNMSSMFASVQGYSGTIDNVNILPQNVVSDAFVDHMNNEKYNGGIALKLIQDSNDSTVLELDHDVFAGTVDKLLREIFIKIADNKSISAIIDAGAFFKSFRNRQVAEGILSELKHIEAVIYYDESSNQPEFLRRRAGMGNQFVRGYLSSTDADYITVSSQVCIDRRFTFYDQRHITGSDIAQPKHAQALMTISPRVLLRDILQGTLRMRLFMTTQHVHLVTTASTREFFYSNLNDLELDGKYKSHDKFEGILVSDILALGSFNEDAKQSSENEKLAFAKIDNEIRSFVLTEISLELESPNIQRALPLGTYLHGFFECARDLFVRSIREDPVQLLRRDVFQESHVVLFEYYRGKVRKLDDFLQNASEVVQDRFKELKEHIEAMIIESRKTQTDCLLYYLPDTMQRRQVQALGTEILMETEMDLQITSHTVTQLRLDQFINRAHPGKNVKQHDMINLELLASNESTILKTTNCYISLKELFKEEHFSSGQQPLVKTTLLSQCENVSVTRDLIEIFDNPQQYDQINHIFTISTRDGSHLLVHRSSGNIKSECGSGSGISVYLISIENARSIYSQLKGKNSFYFQGAHFWLCDLSGRVTITNNESTLPASNVLEFLPETRILILDALIFNGSLPQILSNPFTANLYRNVYLKSGDVKHRAIFLLVRMEVLAKKKDILFEACDPDFVILNTLANGASNAKFFIE